MSNSDAVHVHIVQRREQRTQGLWCYGDLSNAQDHVEAEVNDAAWKRDRPDKWRVETPDGEWIVTSHVLEDVEGMIIRDHPRSGQPYPE